jgi:hypothetical protein
MILEQKDSALPALMEILTTHLKRIEPTIAYAMAQENNHGTSEAAALFVGGSWLARFGTPEASRWERVGRDLLENRAGRLIEPDGSFSQYSVNYHRLMLDTFSLAEVWRTESHLPEFSARLYQRMAAATDWLYEMVDSATGDAPNLGANDGANLLPLTDADYRDYRPSVELAAALFHRKSAYDGPSSSREHLRWLGVPQPGELLRGPVSKLFADGGYAVLRSVDAMTVLRFPRFKFRPGHADALHVDLWVAGENLLRDGGTYSYNADPESLTYFSGVRGHNTVQFDDRDQMPRLGRFLWGDWLKTKTLSGITELDGEAELSRGASMTAADQLELGVGQGVEARQGAVVEWSGEVGELGAQGRSEQLAGGDGVLAYAASSALHVGGVAAENRVVAAATLSWLQPALRR